MEQAPLSYDDPATGRHYEFPEPRPYSEVLDDVYRDAKELGRIVLIG